LREQPGRSVTVGDSGGRELGGQGNPETADGHGQMPLPAVPPAVPPRLAPRRIGIEGGVGNPPSLTIFLVPYPTVGSYGGTVAGRTVALLRPGGERCHQRAAQPTNQTRQGRGQGRQAAFPGAARGELSLPRQ